MSRETRLRLFVSVVTGAAMCSAAGVWPTRLAFPGWWPFVTFLLIATLLETLNTQLRLAARGSTSFIMHMATSLLFGGWWGAVIAAISTLFGEHARSNPPIKIVFNVSQRILAVCLGV